VEIALALKLIGVLAVAWLVSAYVESRQMLRKSRAQVRELEQGAKTLRQKLTLAHKQIDYLERGQARDKEIRGQWEEEDTQPA